MYVGNEMLEDDDMKSVREERLFVYRLSYCLVYQRKSSRERESGKSGKEV